MLRPGFCIFPVHEPTLCREFIRDTQPSLVKVWASVTSAPQLADWRALPHVLIAPASSILGCHVAHIVGLSADEQMLWIHA